jgi:hypothetical protein
MSEKPTFRQLTLFAADSPVKTSALPDAARGWLERDLGSGLSSSAFLWSFYLDGSLSKTSPVYYPLMEDGTLPLSFAGWGTSGIASLGACWTLNIGESHSAAAACSLSDILEAGVPLKYFLSAKAAAGILRRADKRGKTLPYPLIEALEKIILDDSNDPPL